MDAPGRGPVRLTSQQRKQQRFQQKANELFNDTLRIYLGIKNKWVQESEITALSPARINAIRKLYYDDFDVECPWFPKDVLEDEEAQELGLQHSEEPVYHLDVEATEFVPAELEVQAEDDAGYSSYQDSGTTTPVLSEVAASLNAFTTSPPPPQEEEPEIIVFGDFQPGEIDAVASGIEAACAVPESTIDYLSTIMDHPDTNQVINVTCALSVEASAKYYGDSPLADLLQCSEASLLVKSLVTKPCVLVARSILHSVRERAYTFIALADRSGYLDGKRTPYLVNSLCDDAYARSGKKLLNPRTKWKLVAWLIYMSSEYRNNHLSKYIPPDLHPKPYNPRAPRNS